MEELEEMVLLPHANDEFQHLRDIYNGIIMEKISEGSQGIERERYLTITIERKTYEEAKARFATIEATIRRSFAELGSELIDLTGNERLKSIYGFYHLGEEADFDLDIKKGKKMAKDVKNDLVNGSITFYPDHMIQSGKYCRALFIKKYPSSMSDIGIFIILWFTKITGHIRSSLSFFIIRAFRIKRNVHEILIIMDAIP